MSQESKSPGYFARIRVIFITFFFVIVVIFLPMVILELKYDLGKTHILIVDLPLIILVFTGGYYILNYSSVFDKRTQQMERESEERMRFLLALAHETRTPLTSMKSSVELLNTKLQQGDETTNRLLKNLKSGMNTLEQRISDISDYNKIRSNLLELRKETVEVKPLVEGSIAVCRNMVREYKQNINVDIDKEIPPVSCDVPRIQQVLISLISNACKYNPMNGAINIKCFADYEDIIPQVRFEVQDNGRGISEDT